MKNIKPMPKEVRKTDLENLKMLAKREGIAGQLPFSFRVLKKYFLDLFRQKANTQKEYTKAYETKDEVFYITILQDCRGEDIKINFKSKEQQ